MVGNQFYRRNGLTDCATGCQQQLEGAFPLEWRDWGSFGWSSFPVYGFTGDCRSGSCIDTTMSSVRFALFRRLVCLFVRFAHLSIDARQGFAGMQIGWAQRTSMCALLIAWCNVSRLFVCLFVWFAETPVTAFGANTTFRFWAKCGGGPCTGITFAINAPCSVTASPAMTFTTVCAKQKNKPHSRC